MKQNSEIWKVSERYERVKNHFDTATEQYERATKHFEGTSERYETVPNCFGGFMERFGISALLLREGGVPVGGGGR